MGRQIPLIDQHAIPDLSPYLDPAFFHHQNAVPRENCPETMGNAENGLAAELPTDGVLNLGVRFQICGEVRPISALRCVLLTNSCCCLVLGVSEN